MKRLAKALGSRPLATIALMDADATSALNIVASRLDGARLGTSLSRSDIEQISRLGGRSSDLDVVSVAHLLFPTRLLLIITPARSQS
jgi:hypothetical protein